MRGSLIFVSGISGAGKTTLIRYALENSVNLIYLTTLTTRPMRTGENDSFEYTFVTDDEYEEAKHHSKQWDHTAYNGYKYGADVTFVKQKLDQGVHVICSVTPNWGEVESMSRLYDTTPLTIWVDTPTEKAKARIMDDAFRSVRDESDSDKHHFDHIYTPAGNINTDCQSFVQLLSRLLK